LHDKFYNENIDTKVRNISDIAIAHKAEKIANNSMYDEVQRKDINFMSGIMKTEAKFGLEVWNEEQADELHALVRSKFKRRRVISYDVDDIWSCDLVELQERSKQNKGFRYMLNVIDVYGKYTWIIPLKAKIGTSVLNAFKQIVNSSDQKPDHI